MSRYTINPYEKNFQQWEADQKRKRNNYWDMLRRAQKDYTENECDGNITFGGFRYWMERRWGLAIELVDGNISAGYNVTDESKYLLFQMKYA